ncbi:dolichyl-phosphate-mannose-protein mannosyltransferase [Pseudomonas sp. SJZ079]|uniref:ArnT family glycosyltransferase n=1 Tax=Pseudomonas sp. SJZ079 TaxID=2572887 RepID=UPI00119B8650|nr:glycosyltransferase family 39 protein [Pseudomonas sp. SJZ079]TWC39560.1 dolichyl-phosphate-mannose-protein mannosyltransferase [Pseudomonas sp. SJZ079]
MEPTTQPQWHRTALYVLLGLLILRLVLMAVIPLTDTTEARYSEIARKMLETDNWVTLFHDYGVPFWAKPPLSTWLSAAAMKIFGLHQMAARLPALLLSIGVIALTFRLAWRHSSKDVAVAAALILASSLLFFIAAGTVMTDPALMFCVSLSQIAFWYSMTSNSRVWPYLFFVGLGLGLLAKGPLALVLTGLPIFFWTLIRNQWLGLWQRLPWIKGSLLMLAIALPWYILAEIRTPGFLDYFIMGEHVARFLDPGWNGDKYGFAHRTAHGMIWLFVIAAIFPWSLLPLWLLRRPGKLRAKPPRNDGWMLYLCLWTLLTPVFFTMSGNIIFPYPQPMLPGCALLLAELWNRSRKPDQRVMLPWVAAATGGLFLVLLVVNSATADRYLSTQLAVINAWNQDHPATSSKLVYWSKSRAFSAEFYSRGRAQTTHDLDTLTQLIASPTQDYLVIRQKDLDELPGDLLKQFAQVADSSVKQEQLLLLKQIDTVTQQAARSQGVVP